MNYARALATLHHARTGKLLDKKKICNETWLHLVVGPQDTGTVLDEPSVNLELFSKVILTWKPNGNIVLTSAGYKTYSTKDRFKQFLPRGLSVFQDRPFWYVATPTGTRPFRDDMELNEEGYDTTLPAALNHRDAHDLYGRIQEYSKFYVAGLLRGDISHNQGFGRCANCELLELRKSEIAIPETARAHLLEHIDKQQLPDGLALAAVNQLNHLSRCFFEMSKTLFGASAGASGTGRMSRTFLREVIVLGFRESQLLWRKPKTKRALIDQTESLMTRQDLPRLDLRPRYYRKNLQMLIEDFLLETFGYERMEDK